MTEEDLTRLGYQLTPDGRAVRISAVRSVPIPRPQCRGREENVQREIIRSLAAQGYRVLQTTVRVHPCPHCGHTDHRGYGSTPGVPDLLICRDGWPLPVFVGIEVKGPKTQVSDAQATLADEGHIVICRTVDAAQAAVSGVDGVMMAVARIRTEC